jgi:hypothetical protein
MSFVQQRGSDAAGFVAQVDSIVACAARTSPTEVILVRIDNWFGERWLGFAGKLVGAAGVRYANRLVVPPFVPSRVVEQRCYRFKDDENQHARQECVAPLHVSQTSQANFRRFVDTLFPESALI